MRIRSGWAAGVTALGFSGALAVSAGGDHDAGAPLSLANGVAISDRCGATGTVQHIAFSPRATHTFLGYGVNVPRREATEDVSRTVADIRKLGFVWVRTNFGDPDDDSVPGSQPVKASAAPAQAPADDGQNQEPQLFAALHAAGIKIVTWGTPGVSAFFERDVRKNGKSGRIIKPAEIPALAQAVAKELRNAAATDARPDLIEPFNEPNGGGHKFGGADYALFLKDLEADLGSSLAKINLAAPGTATHIPVGVNFVEAMRTQGSLSGLKAITVHTYYFRDHPNNYGIPPADDPALQTLFRTATSLGIPLIGTEFGGADMKAKKHLPSGEFVDQAEEMKAALDLVRQGESAAIVWRLYKKPENGDADRWALITPSGPTSAYWVFDILSRKVPVGSDVLAVDHSDVSPTMMSLGYAAFRSGQRVYVGLSNPGPAPTTVAVDLSHVGAYAITRAAGFLHDRADERGTFMRAAACPLTVTIPNGTGAMLEFAETK
ncbi:MAG: hypothetical protein ABSD74_12440 [Rhizomicrobium sp.]|jgi:hypothetical protein